MIKQIFLKHQFDDAAGHIEDLIREKLKKNIIINNFYILNHIYYI